RPRHRATVCALLFRLPPPSLSHTQAERLQTAHSVYTVMSPRGRHRSVQPKRQGRATRACNTALCLALALSRLSTHTHPHTHTHTHTHTQTHTHTHTHPHTHRDKHTHTHIVGIER